MKTFIIDTETGGISPYTNGLASISIKEKGIVENIKTWFIKPQKGKFYSHGAFRVNGLNLAELEKEGQKINIVLDDIQFNWFNESVVRIIGHNVEFDLKFLMQACKENKVKLPIIEYIDTLDLAKHHLKVEKNRIKLCSEKKSTVRGLNLVAIFKFFYPKSDLFLKAHESETDVLMTEMIFDKLWTIENE